jgi:hypothetical protein
MPSDAEDAVVQRYAQYMADHIDVTILIAYTQKVSMDHAFTLATPYLETEGWQGRVYPKGFFTVCNLMQDLAHA